MLLSAAPSDLAQRALDRADCRARASADGRALSLRDGSCAAARRAGISEQQLGYWEAVRGEWIGLALLMPHCS
jgi:hypothetical protein